MCFAGDLGFRYPLNEFFVHMNLLFSLIEKAALGLSSCRSLPRTHVVEFQMITDVMILTLLENGL
jgi:hypothetical protein